MLQAREIPYALYSIEWVESNFSHAYVPLIISLMIIANRFYFTFIYTVEHWCANCLFLKSIHATYSNWIEYTVLNIYCIHRREGWRAKDGIRYPKFILAPCAQLYLAAGTPHLGSYTRALLVSQERRHLFVTPWWRDYSRASLTIPKKKSCISI